MNKSVQLKSPIIYDFFAKPYSQSVFERKQQSENLNFKGIPATVVGVSDYEELQCLDVQVAIDDIYVQREDLVLESLTLKRVFVALPNAGGFKIKSPVSVGDPVRLKWSHRDLGQYLDGDGSSVQIDVKEIAGVEDCWVELDGGTRKNNTKPSLENWILEGASTTITITPSGKIDIITSGEIYSKASKNIIDNDVEINQNLTVKGDTTTEGKTYAKSGMFASTYAGVGGTSSPANFAVDTTITGNVTINGTLVLDGTTVNGHTHNNAVDPM